MRRKPINQETRRARLKLDRHECQLSRLFGVAHLSNSPCSEKLEAHHITYARLNKEHIGDLITVCKRCHDILTSAIGDERRATGQPMRSNYQLVTKWEDWSHRELRLILDNHLVCSDADIAKIINAECKTKRTGRAVYLARTCRLKLRHGYWTQDEIDIILKPNEDVAQLSKILGRTVAAIQTKQYQERRSRAIKKWRQTKAYKLLDKHISQKNTHDKRSLLNLLCHAFIKNTTATSSNSFDGSLDALEQLGRDIISCWGIGKKHRNIILNALCAYIKCVAVKI